MSELSSAARQAIGLVDLTNLNDGCTDADIEKLAAKAQTPFGPVAALCVFPSFIKTARRALGRLPVKIATVTNFPNGSDDADRAARETAQAFADGADEVDVVVAYHALINGDAQKAAAVVAAAAKAKPAGKILKVILETGELKTEALIRSACRIALENGADFLKTSTGKVPVNATLESARLLLGEIKASGKEVGFKAAGGIKTANDAKAYLDLAASIMGTDWACAETFRFGASGVLDDLIAVAGGEKRKTASSGY